MVDPLITICDAPCLSESFSVEDLASALGKKHEVRVIPYLCSVGGLRQVDAFLRKDEKRRVLLLTGSCPTLPDLFSHLPDTIKDRISIMDLSPYRSPTVAAAHVLFHATSPRKTARRRKKIYEDAVLVIGGGVAGVQASLDLAESGKKVYLAERSVSIGGIMSQLDKTFPTLDCSICILGPKLADVGRNPDIELLTLSEISSIEGQAGHFDVTLTLHPRYVDMSRCTGCGSCSEVCPVILPNEWDLNLKPRKCIHILFAQSIPLRATIDMDHCIKCQLCVQACEKDAINLEDEGGTKKIKVGAIIVAAGLDPFEAERRSSYGYGRYENVYTNIDFERIVCASGPTGGNLIRPDGKPIKRVAFVQCVGSRDIRYNRYCSGYCCMASIKEAMLIRENVPDAEITIFFNDIRAAGKGFEELYLRAQKNGIRFVKGFPTRIEENPESRDLILRFEETIEGTPKSEMEVDFVILAGGVEPDRHTDTLTRALGIEKDSLGFLKDRHPTWGAIETTVPGIFMAGGIQGPKDIPESVAQASGAAARAVAMINRLKGKSRPLSPRSSNLPISPSPSRHEGKES